MITPVSPDINRFWKVTTPPTVEPRDVEELKDFARIDGSDADSLLKGFIQAAREAGEGYLGRALITQSITLSMDFWPDTPIPLPRPPLASVTAVRTLDEDDVATVYAASNYYLITNSIIGQLAIKFSSTPPVNTSNRAVAGYEIEFEAGYGDAGSDVPQAIREGLKLWATAMYEDRVVGPEPPPEAKRLLDIYKVNRV